MPVIQLILNLTASLAFAPRGREFRKIMITCTHHHAGIDNSQKKSCWERFWPNPQYLVWALE